MRSLKSAGTNFRNSTVFSNGHEITQNRSVQTCKGCHL